jgi:hypothetical protein
MKKESQLRQEEQENDMKDLAIDLINIYRDAFRFALEDWAGLLRDTGHWAQRLVRSTLA